MKYNQLNPNFIPVYDFTTGEFFPENPPYGVSEIPSHKEQQKQRRVTFHKNKFDLDYITWTIILSIGMKARKDFILRVSKYDPYLRQSLYSLFVERGSGLFVSGIEVNNIPEDVAAQKELENLLITDQCLEWPAIHAEFELDYAYWRTKEIEHRQKAWGRVRKMVAEEQWFISQGIR